MFNMSDVKSYKRSPAIRCWIHHILEGKYSEEIRSLYTIFGEIKRIRIVATIIRKREIMMNQVAGEDGFIDDETQPYDELILVKQIAIYNSII